MPVDVVHVCWCRARRAWLVWSEALSFWRLLTPGFGSPHVDVGAMRSAIRHAWTHTLWRLIPGGGGFATAMPRSALPPLDPLWDLVMSEADEVHAFRHPEAHR